MPQFITIGYGHRAGYDRAPQAVRDAAHEQDAKPLVLMMRRSVAEKGEPIGAE